MPSELNNSKEVIKTRMLRHALNYWDIKNSDDLDPAVKLILEALSTELYNLGNEIKDTQVRILEKLANLMAPDFLTCPSPAHAIMHAQPVEPVETLYNTTSFSAQKKISSKQDEVLDTDLMVFFTPVNAVQVFDAQVTHIATSESLYAYNGTFSKQLIAQSRSKFNDRSTLWIGLKVSSKIEDIANLFFYFDWKNIESKFASRIYQLLPITKWYINDNRIDVTPGLKYAETENNNSAYENIFQEYDVLSLLERDARNYYDQHFITITGKPASNISEMKAAYPPSFKNNFSDNDLQKLTEKLVWIKVTFPTGMQPGFFEEIQIYTNAFPVMNRQVNDLKFRLKGGSNIIPLKTDVLEQFLSVKSLADEIHAYKTIPYKKSEEEEYGTYTLRSGGVERFDKRNARELIRYLLELLRSESAAFSSYGYDFMATTLKEMHQKIALMEQKTRGYTGNGNEIPNYIIVKPFEGFDMMYVKYWTTLADTANQIRMSTRLQLGKGVKVKPDTVILLTTTTGGKSRLRAEERLQAFRYGIMTRDRIITREDIRNFCFFELGNKIRAVEIEKGLELSPHPHHAFAKTIDVIVTPAEDDGLTAAAWEIICEQLKSKLQSRSGISNNYRVMIKQKD
ncbi:MAG TPA: type VI secretion system baseplate subunit TssF [Parafilimonas sp.]|nr:type VI secretion system baseplate subunit TssF [Parafilimonas sp.]